MTLADIAAAAGVSIATVSRVINQKPGVKESTRAAVLDAVYRTGYETRPATARAIVAVLVPEFSNPSFPQFAQELTQVLYAAGYSALVCPVGQGGFSEVHYLEMLLEQEVSGLISVSGASADSLASKAPYERLKELEIPSVFINGEIETIDAPFFCTSDAAGIELAVEHLRDLGHERIGLAVGQPRYMPTQRKTDAFLALGLDEDSCVTTEYTSGGGARAGRRLLASGHTAIICGSDIMALGLIRDAEQQGIAVPRDLSVIGYDDSPVMRLTTLTTIRQPVTRICEEAVSALLQLIDGQQVASKEHLFAPDLTIRQSTGAA